MTFSLKSFGDIRIQGVTQEDLAALKKEFPQLFKGQSTLYKADKVIQKLMKKEIFESVIVYKLKSGEVVIVAEALLRIGKITVSGHTIASELELIDILGLEKGVRFEKNQIIKASDKLQEYYNQNGFFNVKIKVDLDEKKRGNLFVKYTISENKPCILKSIDIKTENKKLEKKIRKKIKKYLDENFTEKTLNDVVATANKYFKKQKYLKSSLIEKSRKYNFDKSEGLLVYQVSDPFKYDFIFKGHKKLRRSEILSAIDFDNIEINALDPSNEVVQKLQNYYLEHGYAHSKITFNEIELKKNYLKKIRVTIKEGPLVKIKNLLVTGRISRKSEYYSDFIIKYSSELIQDGKYNRDHLTRGFKSLVTELKNQGYLQAKIQTVKSEFSSKNKMATVTIILDEGPLTQVRNIKFTGARAFTKAQLMKVLSIKNNAPLKARELEKSIEDLQQYYWNRGYLEMNVKNKDSNIAKYNSTNTQADLNFIISEGPKIIVGSIRIIGNNYTKDYVILREVEMNIGEVLTPEKIQESKSRLNKLGIFNRVDINTLQAGSNISVRTIIIKIKERKPILWKFGFGANSENSLTARAFTAGSFNNIGGTGRAVGGRIEVKQNLAEIDRLEGKVTFGYLEPFLFDTRYKGRANTTYARSVVDFDSTTNIATINESSRVQFLLERDFTSHFKFIWTLWSIDSRREYQDPKNEVGFFSSTQNIVLIGPLLDFDYRDNPFLPTKGYRSRWSLDYSDPALGSSQRINFIRSEASFSFYQRIGKSKVVWANSVSGGYISNISNKENSGVPETYIFRLGGLTTIRGFGGSAGSEKIPSDLDLNLGSGKNQLVIENNSHYYLIKSELRFPLYKDVGGVIFYDGGEVRVSGKSFERPYRQAVGVGLRYNTPLGPIVIDYAQKIQPRKVERVSRVHFSIGTF